MRVAAQKYLRARNVIPADRYLKLDAFGSGRTQERRRPDRSTVESVQKLRSN